MVQIDSISTRQKETGKNVFVDPIRFCLLRNRYVQGIRSFSLYFCEFFMIESCLVSLKARCKFQNSAVILYPYDRDVRNNFYACCQTSYFCK